MLNELIFFVTLLIDMGFVLFAFRLGKEWLYVSIVLNIILITAFGGKIIPLFGLVTNAGNVFFASIFLATHMLTEHYGKKEGYKTAWVGFSVIVLFVLLSQFTVHVVPTSSNKAVSDAIAALFSSVPRVAFASMVGYVVVQYFNVWFYEYIHGKTGPRMLWLRDSAANVAGQALDSVLFFSIAFYGVLPTPILLQSIVAGFLVKILAGAVGTLAMYGSHALAKERDEFSQA